MEKIFDKSFVVRLIIEVLLLGIVTVSMQKYLESRLAPQTALETLKVEMALNTKKETYFQAVELMNRVLANSEYAFNGIPQDTSNRIRGGKYPTEIEVNTCYAKLWVYSDDKKIPLAYLKFFSPNRIKTPFVDIYKFIDLIRRDLGDKNLSINSDSTDYKYIEVKSSHH